MSGRIDAVTLLARTLVGDAQRHAIAIEISAAASTRWASATFVGARHRMTVESALSPAIGAWLGQLPDADLPVRGHLVADLAIVEQSHAEGRLRATIEVLTVEAA